MDILLDDSDLFSSPETEYIFHHNIDHTQPMSECG